MAVGDCSVTVRRRWRLPCQTGKMHAHAKHYKHEDGRTVPGVCGNGSIPLRHSGNIVTRIGTHTHLHHSKRSNGHETPRDHYTVKKKGFDWLVGCLGFTGPLTQYFSLYRVISLRGRKKREKITERKNVQTSPTASAIGPCPTIIQISRTPRH